MRLFAGNCFSFASFFDFFARRDPVTTGLSWMLFLFNVEIDVEVWSQNIAFVLVGAIIGNGKIADFEKTTNIKSLYSFCDKRLFPTLDENVVRLQRKSVRQCYCSFDRHGTIILVAHVVVHFIFALLF